MSLVHRLEQIDADVVAPECQACGERYDRDEFENFELLVDPLQCPATDCSAGGMIPRRASNLVERFPAELAARFTPLPDA
jgi:hypothetical protein